MKFAFPESGDILWPKYVGAVNPTIDEHCSVTWTRATWYRPWVVIFTPQFPDEVYPILLILWILFMKPVVGKILKNFTFGRESVTNVYHRDHKSLPLVPVFSQIYHLIQWLIILLIPRDKYSTNHAALHRILFSSLLSVFSTRFRHSP